MQLHIRLPEIMVNEKSGFQTGIKKSGFQTGIHIQLTSYINQLFYTVYQMQFFSHKMQFSNHCDVTVITEVGGRCEWRGHQGLMHT